MEVTKNMFLIEKNLIRAYALTQSSLSHIVADIAKRASVTSIKIKDKEVKVDKIVQSLSSMIYNAHDFISLIDSLETIHNEVLKELIDEAVETLKKKDE